MRCRFMLDVAHGMEYLHSQGVIHRDLKPGNVLVSSLDPDAEVLCKITDFGASRQGLEDSKTMTMTCGVGSPYYMSPEMLRGDQKYTRAVDVYSFGIMCLELWNEQVPFAEMHFDTPFSFARYVLEGHRPAIRKDCPEDLAALFAHCWESDRNDRPPFTEVVKELAPMVEEVKKSLPEDVEHVKSRKAIHAERSAASRAASKASDANKKHKKGGEKKKTHKSSDSPTEKEPEEKKPKPASDKKKKKKEDKSQDKDSKHEHHHHHHKDDDNDGDVPLDNL